MAGDMLLTGLSGLTAFKNALDTTGHNIANVNTDGYSRQTVELATRNPELSGFGYVGSGVSTTSIDRAYNEFLATQFRSSSSATSELDSYFNFASQIDDVVTNENIGLTNVLQDFFNALQTVADDPTSIPARQVLLSEAESIQSSFQTLDQLFSGLTTQVNGSLSETVADINNLASGIAALNEKIVLATGIGSGNVPNDLLDKRDNLVDQLSEKVNVSTTAQENGALNVFIGSGQALVLGNNANTLEVQPTAADPSVFDVVISQTSGNLIITKFMTGGELGGALRFRSEVLDPAIDSVGQIAIALATTVNEQHTNGLDLNGAQGLDFFGGLDVGVVPGGGNTGSLSVAFDPATTNNLTGSDYTVSAAGGLFTITRSSDGAVVEGPTAYAANATVDGLVFNTGSLQDGDTYTITPPLVKDAADAIRSVITAPDEIAAAVPIISNVAFTNAGSGDIGNISVSGLAAAALPTSPITLQFDGTNYGATGSDLVGTVIPTNIGGDNYTLDVPNFGTINFSLTGTPVLNDTIVLSTNSGGKGDNRNANLLSDLETALSMSGGTASFQDVYGTVVTDVGRKTQSAESNGLAQRGLLDQTIASKDNVSGVSLDEEAANLIKYQQAYQAASQVILTSRTIFDTLLGAFR
jgi:flagellar hook-associated protein 1 FlgK